MQEAEKLHREILEQKLKQFPKGHPSIGITQNGLGSVLKAQGKYEEAITFLEEALKLREPLTGHGKDAAITRDEIGVCLQGVGRHAEAKAMRLRKGKEQMVCSNEPCSRTPREARVQELRACGRCGSIFYCSEECQRADWKSHKKVCKPKEEGTSHASA